MKTRIGICILTLAVMGGLPVHAHAAAGAEGHGGSALVCRAQSGKIISAKLLDLVEAELEYGRTIVRKDEDPDDQAQLIGLKFFPAQLNIYQKFRDAYAEVKSHIRMIPASFGLLPVDDSYPIIQPPSGCDYEQLANYDPSGNLLISSQIFDVLSKTDRAALFVHESIYKLERDLMGATNSVHARKIVAYLFGDTDSNTNSILATLHPIPKLGIYIGKDDECNQGLSLNVTKVDVVNNTFTAKSTCSLIRYPGWPTEVFSEVENFSCNSDWSDCKSDGKAPHKAGIINNYTLRFLDSVMMTWQSAQ